MKLIKKISIVLFLISLSTNIYAGFEVSGTISSTSTINAGTIIGIATTNPTEALSVSGNALISGGIKGSPSIFSAYNTIASGSTSTTWTSSVYTRDYDCIVVLKAEQTVGKTSHCRTHGYVNSNMVAYQSFREDNYYEKGSTITFPVPKGSSYYVKVTSSGATYLLNEIKIAY